MSHSNEVLKKADELVHTTGMTWPEALDVVERALQAEANLKAPNANAWGKRFGIWLTILVFVILTGFVVKFIDWVGVAH